MLRYRQDDDMIELLNFTPHRNMAYCPDGASPIPLPQVGNARATPVPVPAGVVDAFGGVPVHVVTYGEITGLPEPREGVFLVVSMLIAQLRPDRDDLGFPDDLVRDAEGSIIGFRSLGRVPTIPSSIVSPEASS